MMNYIILFALLSLGGTKIPETLESSIVDESYLRVNVNLDFYFKETELYSSINIKNCSKKAIFLSLNDIGKKKKNSHQILIVEKIKANKLENEYLVFMDSEEIVVIRQKLTKNKLKRMKLLPLKEVNGEYNISKYYRMTSGKYLITYAIHSVDFINSNTSNYEDKERFSIISPSYLISLDMENEKLEIIGKKEIERILGKSKGWEGMFNERQSSSYRRHTTH